MRIDIRERLAQLEFEQRENGTRHHTYDEDLMQYQYMKMGDMRSLEHSCALSGKLSADALRNEKYLFVCSATLSCRFCIEGGMASETAYNISDIFIQNMDECETVDDVISLRKDMMIYYTEAMESLRQHGIYSKPILRSIDYIHKHLHRSITIAELASAMGLNASYLSSLFKKETGRSISDYIRHQRVKAAEHMLRYSDHTLTEISAILSFSTPSHFSDVFNRQTGMTPSEYRRKHLLSLGLKSDVGISNNLVAHGDTSFF